MLNYSSAKIEKVSIHRVGNKSGQNLLLSNSESDFSQNQLLLKTLQNYFLSPFKNSEFFNFYHESELSLNVLYSYAFDIFHQLSNFHLNSIKIAKHLFEVSDHPNIKEGDVYIVHFSQCIIDGEIECDAIGIFKSENKDIFLNTEKINTGIKLEQFEGTSINALEKGCLIFNIDKEEGYRLCVIDNNKANETKYWKDKFVRVQPMNDDYHSTKNFLSLYKSFVTDELPDKFEINKADQSDLLNRSINFFKDEDVFDLKTFESKVIQSPEIIDTFTSYKDRYQKERGLELADDFEISVQAVKKQARIYKNVIKLDKNFHLYIHGDRDLVERGFDEVKGLNFYKVYFREEN